MKQMIIAGILIIAIAYLIGKVLDYDVEMRRIELQEKWAEYDPSTDPNVIHGENVTAE